MEVFGARRLKALLVQSDVDASFVQALGKIMCAMPASDLLIGCSFYYLLCEEADLSLAPAWEDVSFKDVIAGQEPGRLCGSHESKAATQHSGQQLPPGKPFHRSYSSEG